MTTTKKEEVSGLVDENRDEAVECLKELIKTPSVTGDESAAQGVIKSLMSLS